MDDFEGIAYEGRNGPYIDEEYWETVYSSPTIEKSLTDERIGLTDIPDPAGDAMGEWERLMCVSSVVDSGRLAGAGTGNEIVATVAAVLDNEKQYGFEIEFYLVADEKTPWEEEGGDK